jgi:DNA-binding response OmpR family regulator
MPHRTGVEACRHLRETTELRIPAVLLTALDNDVSEADRLAAGVVATVSKPFSPRALVATVEAHLPAARNAA